jgi:hypothetical protein
VLQGPVPGLYRKANIVSREFQDGSDAPLTAWPGNERARTELYWCQSSEGQTWHEGLANGLSSELKTPEELLLARSLVRATISRLLNNSLRRRLDIRPIVLGSKVNLLELRWELRPFGFDYPLRMYFFENDGTTVALCFRSKVLAGNNAEIRTMQNKDIFDAVELAEGAIQCSFANCVDWRQEIE